MKNLFALFGLIFIFLCKSEAQTKIFEHIFDISSSLTTASISDQNEFIVGYESGTNPGIKIFNSSGTLEKTIEATIFENYTFPIYVDKVSPDIILSVFENSYVVEYNLLQEEFRIIDSLQNPVGERHYLHKAFKSGNKLQIFGQSRSGGFNALSIVWDMRYELDIESYAIEAYESSIKSYLIKQIEMINDDQVVILYGSGNNNSNSTDLLFVDTSFETQGLITLNAVYNDFVYSDQNNFYLAGYRDNKAILTRINDSWEAEDLVLLDYTSSRFTHIVEKEDNSLYVISQYFPPFSFLTSSLTLHKVSLEGELQWNYSIRTQYNEYYDSNWPVELLNTEESQVLLFGNTNVTDVSTDSRGFLCAIDIITVDVQHLTAGNQQVQVLPNPAAGNVKIIVNGKELTTGKIGMYDSLGRCVRYISQWETGELFVGSLASGLYHLVIESNDSIATCRLVIK